jgi:DNA ligase (NAD+)
VQEKKKGWGAKSVSNLLKSIESHREVPMHKFLFGIGIRGLGKETANSISITFGSFYNFWTELKLATSAEANDILLAAMIKKLTDARVSKKAIESLINLMKSETSKLLVENLLIEVKVVDSVKNITNTIMQDDDNQQTNLLFGKSIVFTGTLQNFTRKEAEDICRKLGGTPGSAVKASTSFVVVGNVGSDKLSLKAEKATKLGIKVLSENEWLSLIRYEKV